MEDKKVKLNKVEGSSGMDMLNDCSSWGFKKVS